MRLLSTQEKRPDSLFALILAETLGTAAPRPNVILRVLFELAPVVERGLLLLVPLEKLTPLPFTHYIHRLVRNVWKGSYVIYVFLGVKLVSSLRRG